MDKAREILLSTGCSIVVVKNDTVLIQKKGDGIRPILETIEELKQNIQGSIIGDKILGKASALLCVYSKTVGVYSPQSTKTAISILLENNIIYKTDKIIPFIKNMSNENPCSQSHSIPNKEESKYCE